MQVHVQKEELVLEADVPGGICIPNHGTLMMAAGCVKVARILSSVGVMYAHQRTTTFIVFRQHMSFLEHCFTCSNTGITRGVGGENLLHTEVSKDIDGVVHCTKIGLFSIFLSA